MRARIALLLSRGVIGGGDKPSPATKDTAVTRAAATPALGTGETMLPVPGGRIWYEKSGTGGGTPVILLHGGPGYSSYWGTILGFEYYRPNAKARLSRMRILA